MKGECGVCVCVCDAAGDTLERVQACRATRWNVGDVWVKERACERPCERGGVVWREGRPTSRPEGGETHQLGYLTLLLLLLLSPPTTNTCPASSSTSHPTCSSCPQVHTLPLSLVHTLVYFDLVMIKFYMYCVIS